MGFGQFTDIRQAEHASRFGRQLDHGTSFVESPMVERVSDMAKRLASIAEDNPANRQAQILGQAGVIALAMTMSLSLRRHELLQEDPSQTLWHLVLPKGGVVHQNRLAIGADRRCAICTGHEPSIWLDPRLQHLVEKHTELVRKKKRSEGNGLWVSYGGGWGIFVTLAESSKISLGDTIEVTSGNNQVIAITNLTTGATVRGFE